MLWYHWLKLKDTQLNNLGNKIRKQNHHGKPPCAACEWYAYFRSLSAIMRLFWGGPCVSLPRGPQKPGGLLAGTAGSRRLRLCVLAGSGVEAPEGLAGM